MHLFIYRTRNLTHSTHRRKMDKVRKIAKKLLGGFIIYGGYCITQSRMADGRLYLTLLYEVTPPPSKHYGYYRNSTSKYC